MFANVFVFLQNVVTSNRLTVTILRVQVKDVGRFFCEAELNGTLYFSRLAIYSKLSKQYHTRFNKIATQGAPQMAVDKEANSLSRVYS